MNVQVSSHFLSPHLVPASPFACHSRVTSLDISYASVKSNCAHPPPHLPPNGGAFAHMYLVSPGSGVLANFAWFRVRWAALELLTCTWFPTLIVYNQTWKILEEAQADWQIGSSIKDAKNL